MYKLNVDSINLVKYSNTDAHGLFSGTIETDRVVLVNGDGAYLQTDGNFGTTLKMGLVRTWSASRDIAETNYLIAVTSATTTAAVFIYADVIKLQSDFSDVDGFVEYLVDNGVITIDDYVSPKYELNAATIKTAGEGYTKDSIDVDVPGQTGDTAGIVTVSVKGGVLDSVEIKTAGSYETLVASQDIEVGREGGVITVTMAAISSDKGEPTRSAPIEESESESESEPELESEPEVERATEEESKIETPEEEHSEEIRSEEEPESEPEEE